MRRSTKVTITLIILTVLAISVYIGLTSAVEAATLYSNYVAQGVNPLGALDASLSEVYSPVIGNLINVLREIAIR